MKETSLFPTLHIGKPTSHVDGRAKVTGEARYAAKYNIPDLAYGHVVSSAVAKGKACGLPPLRLRTMRLT